MAAEDNIDQAIIKMADQAKAQPDSQKSLHYSQAALNLAHTKSVLQNIELNREEARKAEDGADANREAAVKKSLEGGKKV